MIPARVSLIGVAVLIVLRGVMAGLLPLSADEAYYWLWSKHLALGYFDHPPMIAWLIRAGTLALGDNPLGVRAAGVILSLPASWFVWKSAALLLKDEDRAALAALLFNLTLMISVEMLAATPDMPSIVASAAFVYFLSKLQAAGDGRWWLGAGLAAGLGLLSKFSALFLGAGALIWLIADARSRRWLRTPWPYLGAALALLVFAPALIWQSHHHWMTFAFQFGRVGTGHFTLRFLGEFLGAQLGLATPLIFALMVVGLWRATRQDSDKLLPAVLAWTGVAYFLEHSLHDRVQGNWPCFLYPVLAILAADAFAVQGKWRKISMIAAPLALAMLAAVYAQALFAPLVLRKDPLARVLGRDFAPIGEVAAAMVKAHLADAIVTTDYETTAWLRFTQPQVRVVQLNEPQRYEGAPAASPALLNGRLLYLAEFRRDQHQLVGQSFAYTGFPTQLQTPSSLWMIYPVGQPKSSPLGRIP
ncbi:MAG TPA: glycosyltransferase family 39 protein [Rhizomicrobium sp.]|nr:glycosyltransferase family 39 protein [Rhizomicrobium sp.]